MSLRLPSFCLCLVIGAVSCADPLNPGRPTSASDDKAVLPLSEGVTGQIKGDDGRAVAGATVLAASTDPAGPAVPEMAVVSDAEGRYQWPLRAGRYELTVIADGYQRVSRVVSFRAGEVGTLDFLLSRDPAR
jgi:hypothetical protein